MGNGKYRGTGKPRKRSAFHMELGKAKARVQRAKLVKRAGLVGGDLDAPMKRWRDAQLELARWAESLT